MRDLCTSAWYWKVSSVPTASCTGVEAHTIPRLVLVLEGEAPQGRWAEGTEIAVDLRGAPCTRTAAGK